MKEMELQDLTAHRLLFNCPFPFRDNRAVIWKNLVWRASRLRCVMWSQQEVDPSPLHCLAAALIMKPNGEMMPRSARSGNADEPSGLNRSSPGCGAGPSWFTTTAGDGLTVGTSRLCLFSTLLENPLCVFQMLSWHTDSQTVSPVNLTGVSPVKFTQTRA